MSGDRADIGFMTGFALRSAYLKGRMNVPKFSEAAGIPPVPETDMRAIGDVRLLPPAAIAFGPAEPAALIAAIGALTVLPLRWEPRNTIVTHAAIPRPGGGECCSRLYLNLPDGDCAMTRFRYEPDSHALVEVATAPARAPRPSLSIVADMARIAYGYGEFSLTLAAIEAGHCAGQIASLFAAIGLPVAWCEPPDAFRPDGRSQFHLRTIGLPDADWRRAVRSLPKRRAAIRAPLPPLYCTRRYALMARAGALIEAGRCCVEPQSLAATVDTGELFAAAARRSSGIEGEGFAPRRALNRAGLTAMLSDWQRFAAALGFGESLGLRAHLAILAVDGVVPQFAEYRLSDGALRLGQERDPAPLLKSHVGLGHGYNLEAFTVALAITAPMVAIIDRLGPRGYAEMLVHTGAIGQGFLNAAAMAGLFARPYRAYGEAALEQVFKVDDQIVYLILCGADRIGNPWLPLAPPLSAVRRAAVDQCSR